MLTTITRTFGAGSGSRDPLLLSVEQVPPDAREVAILHGYRPVVCTPLQCVTSIFRATNETLNFWTHFIPAWYFWWKLNDLWSTRLDFANDPYTWAFLSYMLTCCVYPLTSCGAHVFSSMSNTARHVCYFVDYGALSMYSYGAAVLYRAYSLPDALLDSGLADAYIFIAVLNSTAGTLMACVSRFTESSVVTKLLRLGAFMIPYVWESVPLLYRVMFCDSTSQDDCNSPALTTHHTRQFIVSVVGAFAYASHVPERLAPGKFDIIGHSHQLLHICSILATNEQMMGSLLDMESRRSLITARGWNISHFWSCGSVVGLFVVDILIISWFIQYVIKNCKDDEDEVDRSGEPPVTKTPDEKKSQ